MGPDGVHPFEPIGKAAHEGLMLYHPCMCSHYQAIKERERFRRHFGVEPPADLGKHDLWPGYVGSFIRRHPHADVGDEAVPEREALNGLFGLVPHWSQDTKITRHTYNARSETVASKPSFRDAWKHGQHCIIPAELSSSRIGAAARRCRPGLHGQTVSRWELPDCGRRWRSPKGELVHSYTMLTINADEHPLMRLFHKPADEKRMVVVLPPERLPGLAQAPVGKQHVVHAIVSCRRHCRPASRHPWAPLNSTFSLMSRLSHKNFEANEAYTRPRSGYQSVRLKPTLSTVRRWL